MKGSSSGGYSPDLVGYANRLLDYSNTHVRKDTAKVLRNLPAHLTVTATTAGHRWDFHPVHRLRSTNLTLVHAAQQYRPRQGSGPVRHQTPALSTISTKEGITMGSYEFTAVLDRSVATDADHDRIYQAGLDDTTPRR